MRALDLQFQTLHNRAHLLLAICGVLISASVVLMTGKILAIGRLVPANPVGHLLIAGGTLEISAAMVVVALVLEVRWMSELPGDSLGEWIMTSLRYRDRKTRAYRAATVMIVLAMTCHQAAIVVSWVPT